MNLKSFALSLFILIAIASNAQTIVTNKKIIERRPVLLGGGIVVGGGAGSFQIGLNPELLKSYNEYLDLGVAMNIYYSSYRYISENTGDSEKANHTQLGMGAFIRVWPIEQVFFQIQPEYNWRFTNARNFSDGTSGVNSVNAPSVLAGVGYGQHNKNGMSYFSVMFDLVNDIRSPYRMGQLRAQPIFRAGVGFPIGTKKKR